jgi:hypothetical protein
MPIVFNSACIKWFFFFKNGLSAMLLAQNQRISRLMLCSTVYIIVVQVREKIKRIGSYQEDATGLE